MASIETYIADALEPITDRILVKNMIFGERLTSGGIIMVNDDKRSEGIRPRWAEVYAVGPDQYDVKVGEWILVSHGRWTRGMKFVIAGEEMVIQMIDNNDILLISSEPQTDETFTTAFIGQSDRAKIDGSLHNDGTNRDAISK